MKAIATAALAAIVVMASIPASAAGPAPPHTPAKPSSYAPQPRPKNNVYGTPIQPPIMGHRKGAHHKAGKPKKKKPRPAK